MRVIKKILLAILVLALSLIIFLVVSENNPLKTDLLDNSLSLFSKPLFAMVSEGQDRLLLQKWYDDFEHKVKKQEIPPERVEQVACMILNAEAMDTTFSALELTQILDQALVVAVPPEVPLLDGELDPVSTLPPPKAVASSFAKPLPPAESLKQLNTRLTEIYQLNQDLKELRIAIKQNDPAFAHAKMVYEFKYGTGVHVRIDPEVRVRLDGLKNREIALRLKEIERNKRIIWQKAETENEISTQGYLFAMKQYRNARHKIDSLQHQIIIRQDSAGNMIRIESLEPSAPVKIAPDVP